MEVSSGCKVTMDQWDLKIFIFTFSEIRPVRLWNEVIYSNLL